MMFCRAAWQRLAPLALKTLSPLSNNVVPARQMSFGLPASGTNIAYVLLGGGSLTAALVYAYKTINSDSARYNDRIAQIEARSKSEEGAVAAVTATEVAVVVKAAAAELATTAEAAAVEPVSEAFAVEPAPALQDEVAVTTPAVVESETPVAEEPAAPVVEDVAAAAPVAETTAIPMSDLLRTVKIIAGSTAEIAAASIGDQHLVAAVRLAEERSSVETFNGVQVPDIKVGESVSEVSEKAGDEKTMSSGSDDEEVKNEGQELEELPSAPAAEDTATADYVELETEADKTVEPEVAVEDTASLEAAPEELAVDGEMVNDLALEMAVSSVLMLSEDDTISGVAEVTPATAEEDKASCHETAASEGITEPPAALEEALKVTRGAEGEVDVTETKLDAVEEAESTEAT